MAYDPHKHSPPKSEAWRTGCRSIRLKDYDYSWAGGYFVTMCVQDRSGAIHESPLQTDKTKRRQMLLAKIIGRFKMNSAKRINEIRNLPGIPVWQRNYYEHIIRNEKELSRIRKYIFNNPARWSLDEENTTAF